MNDLTLAELFSGIGGWSLAAQWAGGIRPIWCSEIDKFKNKIYEKHFPLVPNLGDIRRIEQPPYADIFTVSFPCTGFSSLGKNRGFEDEGSGLWYEAERIIGGVRPRYIIVENSPTLAVRGLWRILAGLASIGYDAEWATLQGDYFGIQQRRRRLYLVAHAGGDGLEGQQRAEPIFRKLAPRPGLLPPLVCPGWRERRDIPEPRTYGSANVVPGGVHRLRCTGDAIMPLVGMYVLECIKRHPAATLAAHMTRHT
jgi:DNA (cytosine-5)-methyltransferase 1